MTMRVEFFSTDAHVTNELIGVLELRNGRIESTNPNLEFILEDPVYDPERKTWVRAEADPERFLGLLFMNYSGSALRAGYAEELVGVSGQPTDGVAVPRAADHTENVRAHLAREETETEVKARYRRLADRALRERRDEN